MATSNAITKCYICREETTTYICTGCSNHFCFDDLVQHRELLKPQFHDIEHQRNEFMQILSDQKKNNSNIQSFINRINHWEQTSIDKIQQTANEQRQLIQQLIHEHAQKIQTKLNTLTEEMGKIAKRKDFNEMMLNKLRTQLEDLKKQFKKPINIEIREDFSSTYITKLSIIMNATTDEQTFNRYQIKSNLKWKQNGKIFAGGNGKGDKLNQLNYPSGICFYPKQQCIYIADSENNRILKWKLDEKIGQIVAGGNGQGNRIDQLCLPVDVIIDHSDNSLIICDYGNRRVVRWSLENSQDKQIIIENIACSGLIMNKNRDLFVSDIEKQEVKRWRKGEKEGRIVAGGNGCGDRLNQLFNPTFIFIDQQETVYVSDWGNHRIMKWLKDAKEGIVVAGGHGDGNSLQQLCTPRGLIVTEIGDVYVADSGNHRVMCWPLGSKQGRIVAGGNGAGKGSNQFNCLRGLSFDNENNLYVVSNENHRIQRFEVDKN